MTDVDIIFTPLIPMVAIICLSYIQIFNSCVKDAVITLAIGTGITGWAYFVLALACTP